MDPKLDDEKNPVMTEVFVSDPGSKWTWQIVQCCGQDWQGGVVEESPESAPSSQQQTPDMQKVLAELPYNSTISRLATSHVTVKINIEDYGQQTPQFSNEDRSQRKPGAVQSKFRTFGICK